MSKEELVPKIYEKNLKNLFVEKEFNLDNFKAITAFEKYLIQKPRTLEELDKEFVDITKKAFIEALEVLKEKAEDRLKIAEEHLKKLEELLDLLKNM
jgi:N12 class adenine-specific DNA methylase